MQSSAFYEITANGSDAAVVNASALFEAWSATVPDGVVVVFDLPLGRTAVISQSPRVKVRRVV